MISIRIFLSVVVLDEKQTSIESVVSLAANNEKESTLIEPRFVKVNQYGLFSALNQGEAIRSTLFQQMVINCMMTACYKK